MRDTIIFYRSFYEAIRELPQETQAEVYSAIFEYSLNFNEVELNGLSKTIFTLIKPQLDANNKRFENGKKGGRKKAEENQEETKDKPKDNQKETEVEANNNNNNNNTSIKIEVREQKFKEALFPFAKHDKNPEGLYSVETIKDFFNYWKEPNRSKTKMRFEMQKTWDLKSRLSTWGRNDFGKKKEVVNHSALHTIPLN